MKNLSMMLMSALISTAALGCATDSAQDPANPVCGDGTCSEGETSASCASDCATTTTPRCGDGICASSESSDTCAADCAADEPFCGDEVCSNGETTASCAADCPASGPFCGDGTCDSSESSSSCPGDCPAAACSTQNDTCTGETVCVAGSCVAAFGRVYKIVLVDGQMTQNAADGSTWDIGGGLPDPAIKLTLNNVDVGITSTKNDTLTPTWNEFLTTTIPGGSNFKIQVLDRDAAVDDPMFSCVNSPLTADVLRVHGAPYLTCNGNGALAAAHVHLYFLPQ